MELLSVSSDSWECSDHLCVMDSVQVHMYIHYYIHYYIDYVYRCVQDLQYSDIKESRINTDSDENKDEVWWLTAHHSEPAGRTCWSGCSCWHAAVLQRRPEARSCRWRYLPVRILNGGPGHHLWSQHPHRQCWRPLVQPLSQHPRLHGAFKRVITESEWLWTFSTHWIRDLHQSDIIM